MVFCRNPTLGLRLDRGDNDFLHRVLYEIRTKDGERFCCVSHDFRHSVAGRFPLDSEFVRHKMNAGGFPTNLIILVTTPARSFFNSISLEKDRRGFEALGTHSRASVLLSIRSL